MTHLLRYTNTILWCSHCKIHLYVAASLFLFPCGMGNEEGQFWNSASGPTRSSITIENQYRTNLRLTTSCRRQCIMLFAKSKLVQIFWNEKEPTAEDSYAPNHNQCTRYNREYWIIYRGPGFLAVVWFGSFPTTSPPPHFHQQTVSISQSSCASPQELSDGRGVREEPNHKTARSQVLFISFKTLCFTIFL